MKYRKATKENWKRTTFYILLVTAITIIGEVFLTQIHLLVGLGSGLFIGGIALFLVVRWHAESFAYECPACGHKFEISAFKDFISPHVPNKKYLKCPNCNKKAWANIIKKVKE